MHNSDRSTVDARPSRQHRVASTLLLALVVSAGYPAGARSQAGQPAVEQESASDTTWTRTRKKDAQMERWAARIVTVYGERELEVGQFENFRVRLRPGAIWPVTYQWSMGDGVQAIGNNVRHGYERPGTYVVTAIAHNVAGSDTASIEVLVTAPAPEELEDETVVAAAHTASAKPPAKTRPRTSASRRDLKSMEAVDLSLGGYTWVVGSYLDRWAADIQLRELRKEGYRAAIFVDDVGRGSPAFRVLVGQFPSTERAFVAREELSSLVSHGVWLMDIAELQSPATP